ncbi:MAG: dihydroneopterin triphosphate diphosphatase [Gammaproteobacteria bacterium]|nr:dihydroneopterin triphosphate diphosphatase [Gammaproteobacteria bacterium]
MNQPPCKRPESVLVVVYTTAGDVLMLQRRKPAGYWQSVTGSLEWGEVPKDAAVRELFEETGLQLAVTDCRQSHTFPIHPAWRERYATDVATNLEHVFRVEYATQPAIILNDGEHSGYRWLGREAAADLAGSRTNREAILEHVPDAQRM